jgi:hypothetical protein
MKAVEMAVCGKRKALPTDLGNPSCFHIPTAPMIALIKSLEKHQEKSVEGFNY